MQIELVLLECLIISNGETLDMSVEEIDLLTGPIIGRPKSTTFRTSDLVGQMLHKVARGVYGIAMMNKEIFLISPPSLTQC